MSTKFKFILLAIFITNKAYGSYEFTPSLFYTGDVFSNIDGGKKRGTKFQSLLDLGVSYRDKDNQFHLSTLWLTNSNDPSYDLIGNFNQVSNITGASAFRLYRAYWERALSRALRIKVGQLALDDDFMLLQSNALFLNASLGPIPTQSSNNLAPQFPLGALGLWLAWKLSDRQQIQFAIYDGNAGEGSENQDGLDFHLSRSEGATIFLESNWKLEKMNLQLGVFVDTGEVADYQNQSRVRGNYGFYSGVDYKLFDHTNAFLRVGYNPIKTRNINDFYIDLGFVGKGLSSSDQWGMSFLYSSMSQASFNAINLFKRKNESLIELTYKIVFNQYFSLQPDIQYIMNPIEGSNDALVLGTRLAIEY